MKTLRNLQWWRGEWDWEVWERGEWHRWPDHSTTDLFFPQTLCPFSHLFSPVWFSLADCSLLALELKASSASLSVRTVSLEIERDNWFALSELRSRRCLQNWVPSSRQFNGIGHNYANYRITTQTCSNIIMFYPSYLEPEKLSPICYFSVFYYSNQSCCTTAATDNEHCYPELFWNHQARNMNTL